MGFVEATVSCQDGVADAVAYAATVMEQKSWDTRAELDAYVAGIAVMCGHLDDIRVDVTEHAHVRDGRGCECPGPVLYWTNTPR